MQESLIIRNWIHNSNPLGSRRLNMIYRKEHVIDDYLSFWLVWHSCLSYLPNMTSCFHCRDLNLGRSGKGEYPNQLDYNGLDKIKETFVTDKKWYFLIDKFWSINKCILNWVHNSNPIGSRRLNIIYRREHVIDDYFSLSICPTFMSSLSSEHEIIFPLSGLEPGSFG